MVGASEVVASLDLDRGVFSSLVPNYKGYELAKASGIRSVAVVLSATETMNVKNINMGLDKTIAVCSDIVQQARKDGLEARAYLSVALGCPYEGPVAEEHIESLGHKMFDAGASEVIVADTIGAANPSQVKSLFNRMCTVFGSERLSAHFHDTRALALANAWQALECGIRKFDASIGGLGGCPFAPGSAGNLATEDLATMLEQTGFETGVNVDRLLEVVELVRGLVGHDVGGRTLAWLIGKRSAD
jgi:hydroxymethylglutaryl-CoA lyase